MQKTALLAFSISVFALFGCNSSNEDKPAEFPKPGTIVASAVTPVTDDTLNKFIFSIKVIADSNVRSGVYDVDVDYGPNFAEGQFTMPKGGESLKPVIRKNAVANSYIIGFKMAGDTTFYDYFEVSSNKSSTKMQYIKAYSF